jgi:hypothetical protein
MLETIIAYNGKRTEGVRKKRAAGLCSLLLRSLPQKFYTPFQHCTPKVVFQNRDLINCPM